MSRSSTSSPDILGPAGDADYLISSPVKPSFTGRQSIMSPANFGPLTSPPARGRQKRQRVSLSPAKSAHSIRFDDVLLPASPTMKLNSAGGGGRGGGRSPGRRGVSLSPEKGQEMMLPPPDGHTDENGNVSPWRIRVTLEATQDENENENATPGGRRKSSRAAAAKTTKVPLKGDSSPVAQTPGRKRGRPRKSDVLVRDATPTAAVPAGSPGHTPGPGSGPAGHGQGQKKKRGRPRKSVPVVEAEPEVRAEMSMDAPIPSVERDEQRWSPLNIAADADSDDGFAGGEIPDPFGPVQEQSPPRLTFESPRDTDAATGHTVSTPTRIPTPAGASQVASPENTLHAGHTPGPRIYPSPTSSSQVDEDQARKGDNAARPGEFHHTNDPTDEHREYDSIMESEGFSMISLDTLPSAKQHGISSKNLKATKGPLKPFLERESTGAADRLKRRASAMNPERSSPNPRLTTSPDHPPPRSSRSPASGLSQEQPVDDLHMHDAPTSALVSSTTFKRRPLPRLARIIRVGAALEGCLRLEQARSQVSSTFVVDGCRQRLGSLFHDLHPDMQQDLRAGLVLGQEIANRRHHAQVEQSRQAAAEATARKAAEEARQRNQHSTPQRGHVEHVDNTVNSDMRRRMEEWQREREAISREIEMANSSQVIVIDSDTSAPQEQHEDDELDDQDEEPQQEFQDDESEDHEQDFQAEYDQQEQEDLSDDESEDIWQEEARVSHRSSRQSKDEPSSRGSHTSDSHKSSPYTGPTDDMSSASPAFWVKNTDPIPNLGPSKVKQLRQQEVDLSDLYQDDYTPRHYQYYYGRSSPPSASERSQQRETPDHPRSHGRMAERNQLDESPVNDAFGQQVRTDGHGTHPVENPVNAEQNVPDAVIAEERSVHDNMVVTPVRSKQTNADIQGSSWFRRFTSFTPGWLKAPDRRFNEEDIPEDEEGLSDNEAVVESIAESDDEMEEVPNLSRSIEHSQGQSSPVSESPRHADVPLEKSRNRQRSRTLALSGYFTNQHYAVLRHIYRIAKDFPDSFPYHPRRGHSAMLGDWIWTSDGTHGVPVTEGQFAIIDRFVEKLADADLQNGGNGEIGWTEADLHRRLVSVILGEQIREERKAQAREEEVQRREAGAESWLPWPFRARR